MIQFIGMDDDLDPQVLPINRSDCHGFLLTSDGAHNAPSEILSTVAKNAKSGPELVRKLLKLADALGGLDNSTAVYLPSALHPKPAVYPPNQDSDAILATVLCTSGEHDIWIIQVNAHQVADERQVQSFDDGRSYHTRNRQAPQAKNKAAKRRISTKPKSHKQSHDELPLEAEKPVAKLEFSDDGEDKP